MNNFIKQYRIYIIVLILLILVAVVYNIWNNNRKLDLAECISKQATFYGASWCPNCLAQKELFGAGASRLVYVECSMDIKQPQEKICADQKIEKYPTWIFADGSRVTGVMYLESLAKKTGCEY